MHFKMAACIQLANAQVRGEKIKENKEKRNVEFVLQRLHILARKILRYNYVSAATISEQM